MDHKLYLILEIPNFYISDFKLSKKSKRKFFIELSVNGINNKKAEFEVSEDIENYNIEEDKKSFVINSSKFTVFDCISALRLKVTLLYVGQGTKDCAIERLRTHSTLQKILSYNNNDEKKEILIVTFDVSEMQVADTITPLENSHYNISDLTEQNHCASEDDLVNITEAILINYFKPEYNKDFVKGKVPSSKHTSYSDYFKKYYNSMITSMIVLPNFVLCTKTRCFDPSREYISSDINWDRNLIDVVQKKFEIK